MKKPAFETGTTPEQDAAALDRFIMEYQEEIAVDDDLSPFESPEERHARAMAQAIKTVFYLGQSNGYLKGYKDAAKKLGIDTEDI